MPTTPTMTSSVMPRWNPSVSSEPRPGTPMSAPIVTRLTVLTATTRTPDSSTGIARGRSTRQNTLRGEWPTASAAARTSASTDAKASAAVRTSSAVPYTVSAVITVAAERSGKPKTAGTMMSSGRAGTAYIRLAAPSTSPPSRGRR